MSATPQLIPSPERDTSEEPGELRAVIAALRCALASRERVGEGTGPGADPCADAGPDHVASLRTQLVQAQSERDEAVRQRDEEANTVRDLRLRLADSRKAFMRLQSEGESVRKAIAERRQPAATGSGATLLLPGGAVGSTSPTPDTNKTPEDEEEARAKRASKRASLAFGPNGTINPAAARNFGRSAHSRSGSLATPTSSTAAVAAADRKLRGLSLVGGPPTSTTSPSLGAVAGSTSPQPGTDEASSAAIGLGIQGANANVNGVANGSGAGAESRRTMGHRRTSSSISGLSAFSSSLRPRSPSAMSAASSRAPSPRLPPSAGSVVQAAAVAADPDEAADVVRRRSRMLGTGAAEGGVSTSLAGANAERLNAQLNARGTEIERLRLEMRQMRDDLDQMREARDASEVCLQALREYIALLPPEQGASDPTAVSKEAGAAPVALTLPPLPVDSTGALEPGDEQAVLRPGARASHQTQESWSTKLGTMWRRATAPPQEEVQGADSALAAEGEKEKPETSGGRSRSSSNYSSLGANLASLGLPSLVRTSTSPGTTPGDERPATVPEEEEETRPRGNPLYPDTSVGAPPSHNLPQDKDDGSGEATLISA